MVREAVKEDLQEILELYLFLHETEIPCNSDNLQNTWRQIVKDMNHHLLVNEIEGRIVSSCVCVIIPNLSRGLHSYAFIENVVTHQEFRGCGYASACLKRAKEIAEKNHCYKMMLLTGAKDEKTLDFYRHMGYNSTDKTAFIQWLTIEE